MTLGRHYQTRPTQSPEPRAALQRLRGDGLVGLGRLGLLLLWICVGVALTCD